MIISLSGHMKSGKDTVAQMIQLLDAGYIDKEPLIAIQENDNIDGQSKWQIKKFAYKVKEVASILTGIPVKDLDKQEVKEQILGKEWQYKRVYDANWDKTWDIMPVTYQAVGKEDEIKSYTVRKLLQRIGTEAIRNQIHPNAWVNALFADYIEVIDCSPNPARTAGINVRSQGYPNWIITDTRFPNEVNAIKDRNGILIRINRDWRLSAVTDLENGGTANDFIDDQLNKINEHPSETALDDYKDWNHVIDNNGSLEDLLVKVKEIYNQIKKR